MQKVLFIHFSGTIFELYYKEAHKSHTTQALVLGMLFKELFLKSSKRSNGAKSLNEKL